MKYKILSLLTLSTFLATASYAGDQAQEDAAASLATIATSLGAIDNSAATDGSATPTTGTLVMGQDGTNAQTLKTDTTGILTVSDGTGALNVIVDSGTVTSVTAIANALPAGTNTIGDVGNPTTTATLVDAVTLDDSPTSVTATGVAVQDKNKITFYVNYDETEVGGVSAAFTVEVSYDNSIWITAGFYDVAGGATIQTSESLTADGNYVCWMPRELVAPYIRVKVTATGSDADDIVLTSVKMATQE